MAVKNKQRRETCSEVVKFLNTHKDQRNIDAGGHTTATCSHSLPEVAQLNQLFASRNAPLA